MLAAVLNRVLGRFVQDVPAADLRVGLARGDVELRNVALRPAALREAARRCARALAPCGGCAS